MRVEFEKLKEELFNGNVYDANGNDNHNVVDRLLDALERKIKEYENRMEIVRRTSAEIATAIGKFTERVDKGEAFIMSVADHDVINRGTHDINIAMDLNDTMPIDDDWYGLFKQRHSKTCAYTFVGSWGSIDVNEFGYVIEVNGDREINGEPNPYYNIDRFNINEYGRFCSEHNLTHGECDDILAIGFYNKNGSFTPPDIKWRDEIFGKAEVKEEEEPPTALCKDKAVNKVVADIIAKLNEINVDGETMQYILQEVGMDGQMLTQLIHSCEHFEQLEELVQEAKEAYESK